MKQNQTEGVGSGVVVGLGVGVGEGEGKGVGDGVGGVVGMGIGFLGKTSRSDASATNRVREDLLYFPAAKILRPINSFRSILLGTSKVIASDEEVIR